MVRCSSLTSRPHNKVADWQNKAVGWHPYCIFPQNKGIVSTQANCLEKERRVFEQADVFRLRIIDGILEQLRSFHDAQLHERAEADVHLMQQLVNEYFYCG